MPTINYAEAYQKSIEEAYYPTALYSADLWNSPSNGLYTFDGAKHIKVPKLTIEHGRKDRARRTITTPQANYSTDWISYELTQERYWDTLVDPLDIDETNYVVSIANITKQFNLDQKMPEMDRYMFSKLYKDKVALDPAYKANTDAIDEKNALKLFDEMMAQMDDKRVAMQNRVLYVTPKMNSILKRADAVNRTVVLSNAKSLDRSVYSLDDVTIKVVPADLMQTDFDFSDGSQVKSGAKQIDMMLINNGVQLAPQKYSFVGFDEPSAASAGNYLYYEDAYYDVFLIQSRTAGIDFHISDVASAPAASTGAGK